VSSAKCQTGIPEQAFISHLAPGIWHFLLAALVALTVLFTTAQAIGEPASFAAKGSPQVDGQAGGQPAGAAKIRFTVSGPTDVEVAIVNAKGDVVRHLAAGVLGGGGKGSQPAKNPPPEPLKPGLAQELTWDGKDDFGLPCKAAPAEAGRAAGAGPSNYTARVRLGMGGQLERMIPTAPAGAAVSFPTAIGVGPNGDVYVLSNRYMQAGT